MKPEYLYAFYEYMLLPQFGIEGEHIGWQGSTDIGPDETAHYFSTDTHDFILIFEDVDGLGRDPKFIEDELGLSRENYTFVKPKAHSDVSPSFRLIPPAPYKYAPNITGSFTLLKLHHASPKDEASLLHLDIDNSWGWVTVNEAASLK